MKKIFFYCMVLLGLVSCQSEQQKVENLLSDFVKAQNDGDSEKSATLYPSLGELGTNFIDAADAQVIFNEVDSTFQIVLSSGITFDVEKQADGNYIIKDSHGFVSWNEVWLDVFQRTGALDADMSDMKINPIINDKEFLNYLVAQYPNAMNGNLVVTNSYPEYSDDKYSIKFDIRNESNYNYNWDSYSLEIALKDADGKVLKTISERGREVRSGCTTDYYSWETGEFTSKVVSYDIKIILNANYSTIDYLSKFANFSGKEYNNYLSTK